MAAEFLTEIVPAHAVQTGVIIHAFRHGYLPGAEIILLHHRERKLSALSVYCSRQPRGAAPYYQYIVHFALLVDNAYLFTCYFIILFPICQEI